MQNIIIVLFGIFIGISVAGYMFTDELNKKNRKIANQKAMITNRDKVIECQGNKLSLIKKAIDKRFYTVEKLEDEIKSALSNKFGN